MIGGAVTVASQGIVGSMIGPAPEDLLFVARGYASEVVGCDLEQVTAVSRFEDGNRHAVFRVSYGQPGETAKDVVVRLSVSGDATERASAEREASVLEIVGGLAGPMLYDFRETSRWLDAPAMCMQFVPGRPRELATLGPAEIFRLGSVMARVHGRPTTELGGGFATAGSVLSYAASRLHSIMSGLEWVRDPLPAPMQARLKTVAESLQRSFETRHDTPSFTTGEPLALLHGDPAGGNILWNGSDPVLIDWEYARLGDPADEIAYLFEQSGLGPTQREGFWDGYRQSTSASHDLAGVGQRVAWWEPVTLLGSTLWWVERWIRRTDAEASGRLDAAVQRDQDYYFDQVMRRIRRFDALGRYD